MRKWIPAVLCFLFCLSGCGLLPGLSGVPDRPVHFSASSSCPKQGLTRTVELAWNDLPGETGYRLYRNSKLLGILPANTSTFRDKVRVDTLYYAYELVAFNEHGRSLLVSASIGPCK